MPQTARRYIEIEIEAGKALRTLRGIEDASKGSEKSLGLLQRQISSLGSAFRGFVGFLGVRELIGFADAAQDIRQRIGATTDTLEESKFVYEALLSSANELGVGITGLAASYTKLAVAVPDEPLENIVQGLDTISRTLATTGASAQQVNAVLLQMSQALGSGALQGDEFRAVFENAPVLLRAWQEAAGLTGQSLRDLSSTAQLTTESFFQFLPQIQQIAIDMIGITEPALTVARAMEVLKNSIIDIFVTSEKAPLVFTAFAHAIKLVAENLELLITVGAAFGVFKLTKILKESAIAAGFLSKNVSVLTHQQALYNKGLDGWLRGVDIFNRSKAAVAGTTGAMGLLRAAVNTTVGSFAALFVLFETWDWAIDRIKEAAEQMDRVGEAAAKVALDTRAFVDELSKIKDLNLDSASFYEVSAGATFAEKSIEELRGKINDTEAQLRELSPAATSIYAFETDVVELRNLEQTLLTLNKQLVQAEIVSENMAMAMAMVNSEIGKGQLTFDQLTNRVDAFTDLSESLQQETVELEWELKLIGLEGLDKIKEEVSQSFEKPIQKAYQEIDTAITKLKELTAVAKFQTSEEETAKFTKEIAKQNEAIDEASQTLAAIHKVRAADEEQLVSQRNALHELTKAEQARAEALNLVKTDFEKSIDVQFALQDLYSKELITIDQLTKALVELEEATGADLLDDPAKNATELEDSLKSLDREILTSADRLKVFYAQGSKGVDVFDSAIAVQNAFNDALKEQKTTLEDANFAQLEYAKAVAKSAAEQEVLSRRMALAEEAKELAESLAETQNAAKIATGALAAFNRGGEKGLKIYEKQVVLQKAFSDALKDQGVTYREANQAQLAYARQATSAVEAQLTAQQKLNRAQQQSSDITNARTRVEQIGLQSEVQVESVSDVERIVDNIRSEALTGNQEIAKTMFDETASQLERLAEEVSGGYDRAQLERAKRDLASVAETVFAQTPIKKGDLLEAEIDASQEITAPTVTAPVTFDYEAALQEMKAALQGEPLTVSIQPVIEGVIESGLQRESLEIGGRE